MLRWRFWEELAGARVFDLAQDYFTGMPHYPTHPPFLFGLTKQHGDSVGPTGHSSAADAMSAQKATVLQQQTLTAEQTKLQLGASAIYNVILAERDLLTSQSNLVTSESQYAKAKVELDRATGQILYHNNVSMDEAVKGVVSRPPSRIPDTPPAPQQPAQK